MMCLYCLGHGKTYDVKLGWRLCFRCGHTGKRPKADKWSPYPDPPDNGFVKEAE